MCHPKGCAAHPSGAYSLPLTGQTGQSKHVKWPLLWRRILVHTSPWYMVIPSLSIFTASLADQYYALHQSEAE